MINGGAYGGELVEEVVRNRRRKRGFVLKSGGEMVERENVSSYHCY